MAKSIRITLWMLGALVGLILALALYLRSADLSVYEDQVEAYLGERLGLDVAIDGRFELQVKGLTTLTATEVSIGNPAWPGQQQLLRIGYLSVHVDLWSLLGGPMIVELLKLDDVEIAFEREADGTTNWGDPASKDSADRADADFSFIAFRVLDIDDVRLLFVDARRSRPLELRLDYVKLAPDATDILDLDLQGTVNELRLWADGRLGPWRNLVSGRDLNADLDLTLGELKLSVAGSADDMLSLAGIEAMLDISGPAIERVATRLGFAAFADGPFDLEARLQRLRAGNALRIEGNLGAMTMVANGTVDRLLRPRQSTFDFNVAGPDAQRFATLFGLEVLRPLPFRVSGDVAQTDARFDFSGTRLDIGENSLALEGWIDSGSGLDLDITVNAAGPDFGSLGPFLGLEGVPAEAFDIDGHIQKQGNSWRFEGVEAVIGANTISASGEMGSRLDTAVVFRASGPDNSFLRAVSGLQGLPARPYEIGAEITVARDGYRLRNATAQFGGFALRAQGEISTLPDFSGTQLGVAVSGPDLRNVALLTGIEELPDGAFELAGMLAIDEGDLRLSEVTAIVGDLRGALAGRIGLAGNSGQFDLEVRAEGADLARAANVKWLRRFEGLPYVADGRVRRSQADLEIDALNLAIGNVSGEFDGRLSFSPMSNNSDLRFSIAGPDLDAFVRVIGLDDYFPARAFELRGDFDGIPVGFEVRNLNARIGDNDLSGNVVVDLRVKPSVSGNFQSAYLDLSERLNQVQSKQESGPARSDNAALALFSDQPFDVDFLNSVDLEVNVGIDTLIVNAFELSELLFSLKLANGRLDVDPLTFRENAGRFDAGLLFAPHESGYALDANLQVDNVRLGILGSAQQERDLLPPLNGVVRLSGSGASVHEIMAGAEGNISLRHGSGQIRDFSGRLFGDLLLEVLRTLNPLRSGSDTRQLDCAIYEVAIEAGVAEIQELALQTNALTMIGSGRIDFDTEKLDINVRAKPREGIGLSIGSLANSFLKVGGSLGSPRIILDTKGTATTAGAAIATGGLSLLARGLADRMSAAADICQPRQIITDDQESTAP